MCIKGLVDPENKELYPTLKWNEGAAKLEQAIAGGDEDRLKLALTMAAAEFDHPECIEANSLIEQRSFCFEHGKITDTSILLIHGWTACPFEMRELGNYLFEQGYNVYGLRLAGHGTVVADFTRYGQQEWEASSQKGLVIASLLGREVVVIGESLGGALSTILAATFQELVKRLILCAPCFYPADRMAEFTRFSLVRLLIPKVEFKFDFDWQCKYWYGKIPISGVTELVKVARKARKIGNKVICPTFIIQAINDKMVNPKGAKRFFKTLAPNSPQNQLILFTNGHHNLTIDLNPRKIEVFQWIDGFIHTCEKNGNDNVLQGS